MDQSSQNDQDQESEGNHRYLVDDQDDEDGEIDLLNLSLQIQLSATAVATSFVLIFIPNVETISFTAFLVGLLFPLPFAMMTIITMSLTWEIFASMVFAFSGITFPFKILAWMFIGLLGHIARRIGAKYFYEYAVFGAISAFLFDIVVTIPTAFIFLNDKTAFLTVLYTNLILGVIFTVSHTISNTILFAFLPVILRSILPLLDDNYNELLQLPADHFEYLKTEDGKNYSLNIILLDKKRILAYGLTALLIVGTLAFTGYTAIQNNQKKEPEVIHINLSIDYDGVKEMESYNLNVNQQMTVLMITQKVAVVNYTTRYGGQPFIEAINKVWQDQNITGHYWLFYINGEFAQEGANSTYLDNQDTLEWRYSD